MSTEAESTHTDHTGHHEPTLSEYRYKVGSLRLGLWLFIFSDAFVFAGLLLARFNLMGDSRPELDQTVGLIVTAMLLISSFFINRGEVALAAGDQKAFLRNTMITIVLGSLFMIGVVGVEWPLASQHLIPGSVAASLFYTMTGFHAFHVLTGVVFLVIVWNNGRKGMYNAERHWPVEAAAVYWHFIDVVWVFFYPALYLVGKAVG